MPSRTVITMIISPNFKYIFYKPIKCAGSSIEKALLSKCSPEALSTGGWNFVTGEQEYHSQNNVFRDGEHIVTRFHAHTHPEHFLRKIKNPEYYQDYRTISVVRNPWDTMVSYYFWCLRLSEHGSTSPKDYSSDFTDWLTRVQYFKSYGSEENSKVLGSSLEYVCWINEKFWLDPNIEYFVRFENLEKDFSDLCTTLRIPHSDLSSLKAGHRENVSYREFYNNDTRKLVEEHFQKTIKKFEYTF